MARIKETLLMACDMACIVLQVAHVNVHIIRGYLTGRFPDYSAFDLEEPLEKTVERYVNGPN